jgi:hypothetical protein
MRLLASRPRCATDPSSAPHDRGGRGGPWLGASSLSVSPVDLENLISALEVKVVALSEYGQSGSLSSATLGSRVRSARWRRAPGARTPS